MGQLSGLAVGLLLLQCIDQLHRGEEPHSAAMVLNGLHPQGCGNVGLARSRSTHQHHVVGVLQEFAAVQLAYQCLVNLAVAEVKAR